MGMVKNAAKLAEQIARISRDYTLEETTAAFGLFCNDVLLQTPPNQYQEKIVIFARLLGGLIDSFEDKESNVVSLYHVDEARAHLYAALVQSIDADDEIIMGHVKDAFRLLGG